MMMASSLPRRGKTTLLRCCVLVLYCHVVAYSRVWVRKLMVRACASAWNGGSSPLLAYSTLHTQSSETG